MFTDDSYQTAIREIKINAHHMKKALESGNMKETLKYCREMLTNLSLDEVETRNYYSLFILCFDELSHFQENLIQIDLTKKKYNLYETVQYSKTILPRLYLLISVGNVMIQQNQKEIMEFLNDVFRMCKGIQHPCRGLFIRYFLLKTFKTILTNPQWKEFALKERDHLLDFLLKNFREMNLLWIRINTLIDDKIVKKQQRKDLGMLVADNLSQISTMPGMNLEFYKEKVINSVLEIILENQDKISQSYLFDIFLSVFPADYHIPTLQTILTATEKIYKKVNINNIYLNLMDRFTEFAKNNSKDSNTDYQKSSFIYDLFKKTLTNIFQQNKYTLPRCLNLISGFMRFTVNFYHKNNDYINEILSMTTQLVETSKDKELDSKAIKFLEDILSTPLESLSIMILNIDEFPKLMELLPQQNKKIVVQKICSAIVSTQTYLVNQQIVDRLMIFIKPLFNKENQNEMQDFAQILHFVESVSPQENLMMLKKFQELTNQDFPKHVKFFYPIYLYRCLDVLKKAVHYQRISLEHHQTPTNQSVQKEEEHPTKNDVELQEENTEQEVSPSENQVENKVENQPENQLETQVEDQSNLDLYIKQNFSHLFNPPYLTQEEKQVKLTPDDYNIDYESLLEQLHQMNFEIEIENPLQSLQLYLELAVILDGFPQNENLEQIIYSCFQRVSQLFQYDIGVEKEREFYFEKILSYLQLVKNLHAEVFNDIVSLFNSSISLLGDRGKQAQGNLKISRLLVHDLYSLKNTLSRSIKCVRMASRFDKKTLVIYVQILDYILEYIYKGLNCFSQEEIQQILQVIENSQKELEEVPRLKDTLKRFNKQKTQVIDYWVEKITDENLKQILKKEQIIYSYNGKKFQSQDREKIETVKSQIDSTND